MKFKKSTYYELFQPQRELIIDLYSRSTCKEVHCELTRLGYPSSLEFLIQFVKDQGILRPQSVKVPGRNRKPYKYGSRSCELCGNSYVLTSGTQRYCRPCNENGDVRIHEIAKSHGISYDDYVAFLKLQAGCCGICPTELSTLPTGRIHLDHDHTTGRIRGILCSSCNHALGMMKDSPELLRRAADYLEKSHEETQVKAAA